MIGLMLAAPPMLLAIGLVAAWLWHQDKGYTQLFLAISAAGAAILAFTWALATARGLA